ncbi:MAG: dephospho-CoA kinase [Nitrospirae bacterium]|nr:dephospho-CoA kinase [Nitrospirota bacterium]
MFVVALTGNFGMGKSSVASLFRECGAYTLDCDAIVADLLQRKAVIDKISMLLGPEVLNLDHKLNKSVVADIIFQSNTARRRIEALLHPLVFKAMEASIKKLRGDNCLVIVEVPLLFESGFQKRFNRTITVYTNQKTSLARLKEKGVSRKAALARLHAQLDIRQKKRLADYVIDNNGTRRQTLVQVRKIYKALRDDNTP